MSEAVETASKTDQSNTKKGEENFSEEIKDYAKTTMNELLGMFGYDDEITSESVNNLEIKVPSTSEESSTASTSVTTVTNSTPSLPLTVPDDADDDTPVIVKVEGNTTVNDVIRQQNGNNGTTNATTSPLNTPITNKPSAETDQTSSMNVTMTTQSETGQPSLAPHFYAVPPAVRGLYCVVASLPLVVNQSKSAMTFKFWNCITCSEYFLQKPEVVFRVHYPHLFNGQPEWLYQAAVCLKCYHNLPDTPASKTTIVSDSLTHGTFTVINCKTERECSTTTVDSMIVGTDAVDSTPDAKSQEASDGNLPSTEILEQHGSPPSKTVPSTVISLANGKETSVVDMKRNHLAQGNNQKHELTAARGSSSNSDLQMSHESYTGNPPLKTTLQMSKESENLPLNHLFQISQESSKGSPPIVTVQISPDPGNHHSKIEAENTTMCITKGNPLYSNQEQTEENTSNTTETIENNHSDQESYKCYVCNASVGMTSPHGKLRRSKFPSLFNDVPDNVGHFKVCQLCFDHLDQQREQYINSNVPDEERNYMTSIKQCGTSSKLQGVNLCFVCEEILGREPCRLVFRSRYPSMFRGLPEHVLYVPLCDKCYKKLQKVKLRYDRNEYDEESRNYIHFVNLWRAKRGLGTHPVLV